ncbi:Tn3 family transposase, partial [Bacillus thuringiensis]|uniref:Tn3 family transposase n=1 Tax=Bacillus thuringiensis TaxID=1428 RepID=UPI003D792730
MFKKSLLNRGESYHKLRRSVSMQTLGNFVSRLNKISNIWNECSRLLSNCVVYYNASILSNLLINPKIQ